MDICASSMAFFFSSRRRHTMSKRDWSSDVCSSDLRSTHRRYLYLSCLISSTSVITVLAEIGRASCRESVQMSEDPPEAKTTQGRQAAATEAAEVALEGDASQQEKQQEPSRTEERRS